MLKLRAISHSYGNQHVLKDLDLSLNTGQRLAVMGPSGSGKTTLLRIILGLLEPDAGTVENTFQKTAVVFQEPRLLPWRTAVENVNLILGDSYVTMAKARQYLSKVGLEDAADKYPHELSGGMQQRVAIARALAAEGDLLILDEPFKAMDEDLLRQVINLLSETQSTILLVTHHVTEACALECEIRNL